MNNLARYCMTTANFMSRSPALRLGYYLTKQFFPQDTWPDRNESVDKVDELLDGGISSLEADVYYGIRKKESEKRFRKKISKSNLNQRRRRDNGGWKSIGEEDKEQHDYEVLLVRRKACVKWCRAVWDSYRTLPPPVKESKRSGYKVDWELPAARIMESFVKHMLPSMTMHRQEIVAKLALAELQAEREIRLSAENPFLGEGI